MTNCSNRSLSRRKAMPGMAAQIQGTEKQLAILKKLAKAATVPRRIAQRAQVIIMGYEKKFNRDIGAQVGLHPDQVGVWRRRWNESFEALVAIGEKKVERKR